MLATALTVVLGTAPVTALAADVDSTVTEAEQTTPQADTTVKEEVAETRSKGYYGRRNNKILRHSMVLRIS